MNEPPDRIGSEQREHALTELSHHFANGQLNADEFDDRSSRVISATSGAELAEVFADLPAPKFHEGAHDYPTRWELLLAAGLLILVLAVVAVVLWI